MAIIGKVTTGWSGTSGGPGVTQMYIEDIGSAAITQQQAQAAVNAVREFWDDVKALMPDELVWTVSPVVDMYDPANGDLVDTITAATPPASVAGTSGSVYAGGAGMKMNLQTNEIRNGRRVRGAVYLVPSASTSVLTVNGTVASTARTTVNTAGNLIISVITAVNLNLIVWGRPVIVDGTVTRNGSVNYVQAVDCGEKTAILRGRRD